MKILIAPDKFKGSLSALDACTAIKKGVLRFNQRANIQVLPLADGGEGSLEVIQSKLQFKKVYKTVSDPLFRPIQAWYGLDGKTAYIEMAKASGLMLLKKEDRHAAHTTTLGTGELIIDALQKGAKKVYLFIGGSASNDAGIGMAHALGYRFLNSKKEVLSPIGASLNHISFIEDAHQSKINDVEFIIVSDVKNPLFGTSGAAKVYAKQKGASQKEIQHLDLGLQHFNELIIKKWSKDFSNIEGAGAAGGLGLGAMLFLNAKMKTGINTIMEILDFEYHIKHMDLVISGEGKLDKQTFKGKVVSGVMDSCIKNNKPLGIICGILDLENLTFEKLPFTSIQAIKTNSISLDDAMNDAFSHLSNRTENLMEEFSAFYSTL